MSLAAQEENWSLKHKEFGKVVIETGSYNGKQQGTLAGRLTCNITISKRTVCEGMYMLSTSACLSIRLPYP